MKIKVIKEQGDIKDLVRQIKQSDPGLSPEGISRQKERLIRGLGFQLKRRGLPEIRLSYESPDSKTLLVTFVPPKRFHNKDWWSHMTITKGFNEIFDILSKKGREDEEMGASSKELAHAFAGGLVLDQTSLSPGNKKAVAKFVFDEEVYGRHSRAKTAQMSELIPGSLASQMASADFVPPSRKSKSRIRRPSPERRPGDRIGVAGYPPGVKESQEIFESYFRLNEQESEITPQDIDLSASQDEESAGGIASMVADAVNNILGTLSDDDPKKNRETGLKMMAAINKELQNPERLASVVDDVAGEISSQVSESKKNKAKIK